MMNHKGIDDYRNQGIHAYTSYREELLGGWVDCAPGEGTEFDNPSLRHLQILIFHYSFVTPV